MRVFISNLVIYLFFTEHLRSRAKRVNGELACHICGEKFKAKHTKANHMRRKHKDHKEPNGIVQTGGQIETAGAEQTQRIALQDMDNVSNQPDIPVAEPNLQAENNRDLDIQRKLEQRHEQIRTFIETRGRTSFYNYDVTNLEYGPGPGAFEDQLKEIYKNAKGAFKINASLGLLLKNRENGELRYFAPGPNLVSHERPVFIHNNQTFNAFVQDMKGRDLFEWSTRSRPTTKFVVLQITNVLYEVTRTSRLIGGAGLDSDIYLPFIEDKRFTSFIKDQSSRHRRTYMDKLCFFRCLAKHRGHNHRNSHFEDAVYALFRQYIGVKRTSLSDQLPSLFPGVTLMDLPSLEQIFRLGIFVYDITDKENPRAVFQSDSVFSDKIHLGLVGDHFMFIHNFEILSQKFVCPNCEKNFTERRYFLQHKPRCPGKIEGAKLLFKGRAYRPKPTVFEELEDKFGIVVPQQDRFYPHVITYDFESLLATPLSHEKRENTDKLSYDRVHTPISVAVASNIVGYETYKFIQHDDPNTLVKEFLLYLLEVSKEGSKILRKKYAWVEKALEECFIETEMYDGDFDIKEIQKIEKKFSDWLDSTPTVGFNSAAYDLKLCRKYIFQALHLVDEEVGYVIKKHGCYTCIKTTHLKFIDIVNYLAPGYSYDNFLVAYKANVRKSFFPYEWFTSPDKLDFDRLPCHSDFYSTLKGSNITVEEYESCQKIWDSHNFKTFRDYLEYYNALDVTGFVTALENLLMFYHGKGLDPFKDSVSLPGIVERYLYKNLDPSIYLRSMETEEIYNIFRKNIHGGPSIVFHRHHASGKTRIRQRKFGDAAKVCQRIIGFDANSLYLWALAQNMPTGPYVIRGINDGFKPHFLYNDGIATAYLEFLSQVRGVFIQHALNGGEKKIGYFKLDGFIPSTHGAIEIMGCYHHGCPFCYTHTAPHPHHKGKTYGDVYEASRLRNNKVRQLVSHLEVKWECDIWKEADFLTFLSHHRYRERNYETMTEQSIIKRVVDGSLFGCVECDVEVPFHLQENFSEFPPIFKNSDIPFRLYGDHMQTYARGKGMSETASTGSLISSLRGQNMLFTTPLLRWYLEHGLVVSNVQRVIQYTPAKCFASFTKEVSFSRLQGARDPSKEILAQTFKLMGNSAYGRTVMRKDKHSKVIYVEESEVDSKILDPYFQRAEMLQDEFYEIEQTKSTIDFDLPIQIGYFVYQYAKLRMVQFYHDFIAKYFDESIFQLMYMDTDSAYFAFAGSCLDRLVKSDRVEEFCRVKHTWLPRNDTTEHALVDKYTPGLFKIEFTGSEMICLNSKTYFCIDDETEAKKFSCKGVSKRLKDIKKNLYTTVMETQETREGVNRGFRLTDGKMWSYKQTRAAFTYFYIKREVLDDGVSTKPLDL